MNVATSMHRIDVIYLNDKGKSLAEGEPHQSYTCITLQWCSESRRKHTPIPMDKHLNSNVQVINHCQYARGEEFIRENVNKMGYLLVHIFFTFCFKILNEFSFKCKSVAQIEFWVSNKCEQLWGKDFRTLRSSKYSKKNVDKSNM